MTTLPQAKKIVLPNGLRIVAENIPAMRSVSMGILTGVGSGNEVANCVIRRCGADSRGAVGVFVAFSADTRVAHNVIHDMPYTGISIGYRWDTSPTTQVRCIAEYNHIHDVMKKLADGAGIYTLGFQPGTVLRGNLIHNVHRSAYAHGGAPTDEPRTEEAA